MRLLLGLVAFLVATGCSQDAASREIKLEPTPLRKLKQTYGVVNVPILAVLSNPSEEAMVNTVLYRGTIVDIESVAPKREVFKGTPGRWYSVHYQGQRGWVFSTFLDVFEDLHQARQRVEAIRTSGASAN